MNIDLRVLSNFPQMHDGRIISIIITDDKIVMCIDNSKSEKWEYMRSDNTTITFSGSSKMGYSICFLMYEYKKNLSIRGKEYDEDEFIKYYNKKKMQIEIIDMLYMCGKIMIKGKTILNQEYKKYILIEIEADNMSFEHI